MLGALLIILVLILLFGGLGIFVAKAFFIGLVIVFLFSLFSGGFYARRKR